jgi:hypothetical protein
VITIYNLQMFEEHSPFPGVLVPEVQTGIVFPVKEDHTIGKLPDFRHGSIRQIDSSQGGPFDICSSHGKDWRIFQWKPIPLDSYLGIFRAHLYQS